MKPVLLLSLFMLSVSGITAQSIEQGLIPKDSGKDSLTGYSLTRTSE